MKKQAPFAAAQKSYVKPEGMANYTLTLAFKVMGSDSGVVIKPVEGWNVIPVAEHIAFQKMEFNTMSEACEKAEGLRLAYWNSIKVGDNRVYEFYIRICDNVDNRDVYHQWFKPRPSATEKAIYRHNKRTRK